MISSRGSEAITFQVEYETARKRRELIAGSALGQ